MALENKKLSSYDNLLTTDVTAETKLVSINNSANRNLRVGDLLYNGVDSTSTTRALTAAQGKVLKTAVDAKAPLTNPTGGGDNYAPIDNPTFMGNVTSRGGGIMIITDQSETLAGNAIEVNNDGDDIFSINRLTGDVSICADKGIATISNPTLTGIVTIEDSILLNGSNMSFTGGATIDDPRFTGTVKLGSVNGSTGSIDTSNTSVGLNALLNARVGVLRNTAIGVGALTNNGVGGTTENQGYGNTAVGSYSLDSNTFGNNNSALGIDSLTSNTTGSANVALGHASLRDNTTGIDNVGVGGNALLKNTTGYGNTSMGLSSLSDNVSGNYNTSIGKNAGDLCTGDNNIFIGSGAIASAAGVSEEIVIGAGAIGKGSNTITIGKNTNTKTYLKGDLNIVGTAPIPTGTINLFTAGATTITGTGTNFLSYFDGDSIVLTTHPPLAPDGYTLAATHVIQHIVSDTQITLATPTIYPFGSGSWSVSRLNPSMSDAPNTATSAGVAGDIRFCTDYIYVCVNTNAWKRTAITSWT